MYRRKLPVLLLACLCGLALLTGCARAGNPDAPGGDYPGETAAPAPAPAEETPPPSPAPDSYTLNEAIFAMPHNWNAHSWETVEDEQVLRYTASPLLDVGRAVDPDGFEHFTWIPEMALSVEDATADWTAAADWGISPEEKGRVWRIRLNPDACWADEARTPIDAETYLYSMRQLLSPDMRNYRAISYCEGAAALLGADGYFRSGSTNWVENVDAAGTISYAFADWVRHEDGQYFSVDGDALFFMLRAPISYWLRGYSLEEYYQMGIIPEDSYAGLSVLADEEGYIPVTDDSIALLFAITGSGDWGYDTRDDLAYYAAYRKVFPVVDWDSVGLLKEDDHTLLYLCAQETSQYDFYVSLTSSWLVYEPLYEAGKTLVDGLVLTNYGSSPETYMASGPYALTELLPDRQLVYTRSESWYGYHDGKHQDQYQTTRIVNDLVADHDAALRLFESGRLDTVSLLGSDMDRYRDAENLLVSEEDYTYRIFMATDRDALTALQEAASSDEKRVNKLCLANDAFRQALSFAIDRSDFVKKGTAGYQPALGLLDRLYYYDIAQDSRSVYRESEQAKAAICRAYGASYGEEGTYPTLQAAYDACTGYDEDLARSLFRQACEELTAAGDWDEGMVIELSCAVTSTELTPEMALQNRLLQSYLDAATAGTGFEGKLTLTFTTHADRYDAVENGEVEMGIGAWGGAYFYPFNMMQCYCDPEYKRIPECCGFDPTTETLTISVQGTEVTKPYQAWSRAIVSGGEYAQAELSVKLELLAALESALIQQRHFIVLCSKASVSLHSDQVRFGTEQFNILYQFGGIRELRYNYSDAAWDARLAQPSAADSGNAAS